MRGRVVDLLAPALAVVTGGVGAHALGARVPGRAVPYDLLDAHAPRERVRVAGPVGGQQEVDQALGLAAVGAVVYVEVPVDRPPLGVQRGAALAPALAAHDPPERAAGVLVEPGDERLGALGRALAAVLGVVVAVLVDRQVDQLVGRVAGHRAEAAGEGDADRGDGDQGGQYGEGEQTAHSLLLGRSAP